jgi:hypoxanthine phosphoribosyltransferase
MTNKITLWDKQLSNYIANERILERVKAIGQEINRDYEGKRPLFLAILNGAFMFASNLFQHLCIDCEVSFIKLSSYQGTESTGNVQELIGLEENLEDRHVIVLEDIVDSGITLAELLPQLESQMPASVRLTSLIQKPDALQYDIEVHYLGFTIPDKFVVGYGLDYDGLGRNLRDIYQLDER